MLFSWLLHYICAYHNNSVSFDMCSCVPIVRSHIRIKAKSVQVYKCAIFAPKVCCICSLILDYIIRHKIIKNLECSACSYCST